MNHLNAVEQFESDLRKSVKRLSRGNYEDSIREVCEHYDDLYTEALSKGIREKEAGVIAEGRLGVIGDIARKIVDSPARIRKGIRLQWLGATMLVLSPFYMNNIFQAFLWLFPKKWLLDSAYVRIANPIFMLCTVIIAIGAFKARHLSWKPVSFGTICIALMLAPSFVMSFKLDPQRTAVKLSPAQQTYFARTYVAANSEFEAAMQACAEQQDHVSAEALTRLKVVIDSGKMTNVAMTGRKSAKWLFPFTTVVGSPQQLYDCTFGATNSLKDSQLVWRNEKNPKQSVAAMKYNRLEYIAASEAFDPSHIGAAWSRPARFALQFAFYLLSPVAMGYLAAWVALRLYIYRRDSFRFRRT
jgi:hypothetical protein